MKPPRWTWPEWDDATMTLARRCNSLCWWCGQELRGDGVRHHRQRRREGGDRISNVILLHSTCHNIDPLAVHAQPALARHRGFIVPTWASPQTTPIQIREQWWLLDDEGVMVWTTAPDP